MVIRNILILVLFAFCLCTCGLDNALGPSNGLVAGQIRDLNIVDNRLTFTTQDSVFVFLNYRNRIEHSDYFKGWSAGSPTINHAYNLPVSRGTARYYMQLRVYCVAKSLLADTTFAFTATHSQYSHLKVHFINVQQGDAILIQTPDEKNIQIDGGYGTLARFAWQGGGEALALNYLTENNITHLHYIIETHRHQDHWGGLRDIVNSHITHDLYISPSTPHGYRPGARLALDSPVEFVFYNIGYPPTYFGTNPNNTSIVLKMTYGDAEFLFTGDAEGAVQDWLLEAGFDISVNVLKVSHHGANTNGTSTPDFLSQVLNQYARIAILSYGTNNTYGHPRSLSNFSSFQTFGTNPVSYPPAGNNFHFDSGTIIVLSDGRMVFVTTER